MTREAINFYWSGDYPPFNFKENLRAWSTALKLSASNFTLNLWLTENSLNHLLNYCPNEIREINNKEQYLKYRWFINSHEVNLKVFTFAELFHPFISLQNISKKEYLYSLKEILIKLAIASSTNGIFLNCNIKPNFKITFPENLQELSSFFYKFSENDFYLDPYICDAFFTFNNKKITETLKQINNFFQKNSNCLDYKEQKIINKIQKKLLSYSKINFNNYKKFYSENIEQFFYSKNKTDQANFSELYTICRNTKLKYNNIDNSDKEKSLLLKFAVNNFCELYLNNINRNNAIQLFHYNIEKKIIKTKNLLSQTAKSKNLKDITSAIKECFSCSKDKKQHSEISDCSPYSLVSFALNELQCYPVLWQDLKIVDHGAYDFTKNETKINILRKHGLMALQDLNLSTFTLQNQPV